MSSEAPHAQLRVVLHADLYRMVSSSTAELERATAVRVTKGLRRLGVPNDPEVTIVAEANDRAVRALLDGVELPFPPSFLARHWFAATEGELREAGFDSMPSAGRGLHGWLIGLVGRFEASDAGLLRSALSALVQRLVPDVLSLHPASLLRNSDAAEWLPGDEQPPLEEAGEMLRGLLELGVSIENRNHVAAVIRASRSIHRTWDEAFEETFAALHAPTLEVHVDQRTFDVLGSRPGKSRLTVAELEQDMREAMAVVQTHRLRKLGVDLPVIFVRSRSRQDSEMRIQVNNRRSPPVPLPGPDEVAVSVPPRLLQREGISGRRLIDPVTGAQLTAVAVEASDAVLSAGCLPVSPGQYAVAALARNVTPLAYRTIAVDTVERALARFEPQSPVLVHHVLSRFSLASITRLLRALVREAVAIDDLWRILNALGRFRELEEARAAENLAPIGLLAHVRQELSDRIVVEAGQLEAIGRGTTQVHETTTELEEFIERWADAPPADTEVCAVRDAVWRALGDSRDEGQPVLVTSPAARMPLRVALDHELPAAHVIARTELVPGFDIAPMDVVRAPSADELHPHQALG